MRRPSFEPMWYLASFQSSIFIQNENNWFSISKPPQKPMDNDNPQTLEMMAIKGC